MEMNLKQKHILVEALAIQKCIISRKALDSGTRSEGAMTSDRGINPNGGQKLKLALLVNNTKAKLRKSSKHKVNLDRFTQLTLQVKTFESIKPPRSDQQVHYFDQSKDQTIQVLKTRIDSTKLIS